MRRIAILLALALAACAPPGESGTAGPSSIEGEWIAERIAGTPVAPPGSVTMTISGATVSGNGGCNSYGGGVSIKGATIKFGDLASTMMACVDDGQMRQEGDFHAALRDASRYASPSPGRLEITGPGGRTVEFSRKP